jgi:tetratricopeptide (TPR) repeat protein
MKSKVIISGLITFLLILYTGISAYAQEAVEWKALDEKVVLLYNEGNYDHAIVTAKKALIAAENALGPDHPSVAVVLNNFATACYAQGLYEQAEPLYKRSLEIKEKVFGPDHLDVAQSLNNLATLYYAQGLYERAEPLYVHSLEIREQALGSNHPAVSRSLNNLGILYRTQVLYPSTKELIQKAPSVNVDDLYARITKGHDIIILDVRRRDEQCHKHIPNSIRFPETNLSDNIDDLKNILRNINKGATIAVFSSDTANSNHVTTKLRSWGYRAYSVGGGFASWERQGYPVTE